MKFPSGIVSFGNCLCIAILLHIVSCDQRAADSKAVSSGNQVSVSYSDAQRNVLVRDYYSRPADTAFIRDALEHSDADTIHGTLFQSLVNDSGTKFIAFYYLDYPLYETDSARDRAYILCGVRFNDRWYTDVNGAMFVDSTTSDAGRKDYFCKLMEWGFFKENTDQVNLDFWERNFFERVEDEASLRLKELDAQTPKSTEDTVSVESLRRHYQIQKIVNQNFIGYHKIVANGIKSEQEKLNQQFLIPVRDVLYDFFEEYCPKHGIADFDLESKILFTGQHSMFIIPVTFTYGKDSLQLEYFAVFPGKNNQYAIYRWNYFKPADLKSEHLLLDEMTAALNQVALWGYEMITLEDPVFWNKYVLARSGEQFLYLEFLAKRTGPAKS